MFAALGWTASVCLSVGGKDSRQQDGILGNTKQSHIKFPLKCHGEGHGACETGEDRRRGGCRCKEQEWEGKTYCEENGG